MDRKGGLAYRRCYPRIVRLAAGTRQAAVASEVLAVPLFAVVGDREVV
ncbi:MAG: hypothetical protein GTO53_05155 [Planctomycetales bacterium]|nr:hypothetical protein [Planctomycetales bacterium]NIM08541.1 hypothetical protein [Planctomycetales bacterium]NIN08012.1 hypothetical protein [Planctomycetales bacterium]NIN77141.1 hypothetical protein [Planctomycetales bacterium]NIO34325.1 hypothetical protein [Planctomycetales bacterium]